MSTYVYALIALALLATPAAANTIVVDYTPDFLAAMNPDFFLNVADNYPGCTSGIADCFDRNQTLWWMLFGPSLFNDFPLGTQFVFAAVPEPSTWALMLFGFAFVALKKFALPLKKAAP